MRAVASPATTLSALSAPIVNTTSAPVVVANATKKKHSFKKVSHLVLFGAPANAFRQLVSIVWLTFIATALTGVLSLPQAYKFSSTERGLTTDADFWFLLQASSFQFCGLVVTGLTLWKDASKWNWVPIGLGLACSVGGPVLYCRTLPFYGVLLNALGGFLQAIVVMWGAIAERSK